MKKTKFICAALAALLAMSAVSCGSSDSSSESSSSSETVSADAAESSTEETTQEDTTESPSDDENTSAAPSDDSSGDKADINNYINTTDVQPALWKATDPETGNELFLMGTIHVLSEDFPGFPDYVTEVYENSDGVAVEYDSRTLTDMSVLQELLSYMVYSDGTTIKDHLSEKAYDNGVRMLTNIGSYSSMLDYYYPGLWMDMINSTALLDLENATEEGVDYRFCDMAEKDGKEIVNIETLKIQADAICGYSDELASWIFENTDDPDPAETAENYGGLYDLWAKGKVDDMLNFEDEFKDMPEELQGDKDQYYEYALYGRNKGMADAAESFLKDGKNYFFMVGALHFAGDRGVDDLLEEKGYTVERLH